MIVRQLFFQHSSCSFLHLILRYIAAYPVSPSPADATGVVIGSLLDFAIIAPLLILAITRKRGFTFKRFITFMVLGVVAARFIIPGAYFEPFKIIPYAAIALEAIILFAEIGLLFILFKHLPSIIKEVKSNDEGPLFSFTTIVEKRVRAHPLIKIIASEMLDILLCVRLLEKTPDSKR